MKSFLEYFLTRIQQDNILIESFCLFIESSAYGSRGDWGASGEKYARQQLAHALGTAVLPGTGAEDRLKGIDAYIVGSGRGKDIPIQIKTPNMSRPSMFLEALVNYNPYDREADMMDYYGDSKNNNWGQALICEAQKYIVVSQEKNKDGTNKIYEISVQETKDKIVETLQNMSNTIGNFANNRDFNWRSNKTNCELSVRSWTESSERGVNRVRKQNPDFHYKVMITIPYASFSTFKEMENLNPDIKMPSPETSQRPAPRKLPPRQGGYYRR